MGFWIFWSCYLPGECEHNWWFLQKRTSFWLLIVAHLWKSSLLTLSLLLYCLTPVENDVFEALGAFVIRLGFLCRCGSAESAGDHPVQHSRRRPNLHPVPAPHDHPQHQAQYPRLPPAGTTLVLIAPKCNLDCCFLLCLFSFVFFIRTPF